MKNHFFVADETFNARKEHHFTLGTPSAFEPEEAKMIGELYETLLMDPRIKALMQFDFSSAETQGAFDKKLYLEKIVPILIEKVKSSDKIKSFLETLNSDEQQLVDTYLKNSENEKAYAFVKSQPDMEIKNLLALAREGMLVLLPMTADKLCNVHYFKSAIGDPIFTYKKGGHDLKTAVRTCLYNFELGGYHQGFIPIDFDTMNQNPQFIRLLVQAKFFNGETFYTEKEVEALKAWIVEKGAERMYRLFYEHILSWKANSRAAFSSSPIGCIFKELRIKNS